MHRVKRFVDSNQHYAQIFRIWQICKKCLFKWIWWFYNHKIRRFAEFPQINLQKFIHIDSPDRKNQFIYFWKMLIWLKFYLDSDKPVLVEPCQLMVHALVNEGCSPGVGFEKTVEWDNDIWKRNAATARDYESGNLKSNRIESYISINLFSNQIGSNLKYNIRISNQTNMN